MAKGSIDWKAVNVAHQQVTKWAFGVMTPLILRAAGLIKEADTIEAVPGNTPCLVTWCKRCSNAGSFQNDAYRDGSYLEYEANALKVGEFLQIVIGVKEAVKAVYNAEQAKARPPVASSCGELHRLPSFWGHHPETQHDRERRLRWYRGAVSCKAASRATNLFTSSWGVIAFVNHQAEEWVQDWLMYPIVHNAIWLTAFRPGWALAQDIQDPWQLVGESINPKILAVSLASIERLNVELEAAIAPLEPYTQCLVAYSEERLLTPHWRPQPDR